MQDAKGGYHEQEFPTFTVSGAIGRHIRVKFDEDGKLEADGASGNDHIGQTNRATAAADESTSITMRNHPRVQKMVTAGAVTLHAKVYKAASGKVDDTGTVLMGIALEAASAANEVIEVLPVESFLVAEVAALTDSSGGEAADGTIAALTGVDGSGSNAAPLAGTKNAIAELAAKINEVIEALQDAGLMTVSE